MPDREPRRIRVSPTSELATLLADAKAGGGTILVDTGETVYPLTVREPASLPTIEEEEQAAAGMMESGYDPGTVRDALRASAGALAGVNIEQLLSDVYSEREQHSSGRPA